MLAGANRGPVGGSRRGWGNSAKDGGANEELIALVHLARSKKLDVV
jgi:hypothetical protein